MQYRGSFARAMIDFGVIISTWRRSGCWPLLRYLDGWSFAELALLYGMVAFVGARWK
jgi:hypothetical protein